MITSLPRLIWFPIAALIMSSPNVKAEERITCPSLEKAAELVEMKVTHFGGDDWEVETKDESVFYVALDYDLCIFRFVANLSHFIPSLNDAGDEWGSVSKIGTLIESDGDVFFKHHVLLPFGSEKTLSYNIGIFDYLATKAIDSAKKVKVNSKPLGKSL